MYFFIQELFNYLRLWCFAFVIELYVYLSFMMQLLSTIQLQCNYDNYSDTNLQIAFNIN